MLKSFGPLLRQYAVVIVANLSILCVSLSQVWSSPVLVKLQNETTTVLPTLLSEEDGSWLVSLPFLSGALATPLSCYLVDKFGRRNSMIIASIPRIIVCLAFIYATQIYTLMVGRFVIGICDTISFTAVPVFTSEISSKECRGALGTIIQIASSLGILLMYSVGPFASYIALNWMCTGFSIAAAIPLFLMPESPYFLYSKGKEDKSKSVLLQFRSSELVVEQEIEEYKANSAVKVNKKELFYDRIFRKSFFLVLVMSAGFQLVGFTVMSFYLQTILDSTKTSVRSEMASVVMGIIQIVSSLGTSLTIDRYGRKIIIIVTLIGMAFGMMGLGTFFKIREHTDISASSIINYLPLVSLALVVYCFSAGLGSINWILSAELFEDKARGLGVSVASLNTCVFAFFTSKFFVYITNTIGAAATYWIFSVNCMLFCLFITFCIPETKGKTYAEIQKSLGKKCDVKS